jgi:spore coat protein CotH
MTSEVGEIDPDLNHSGVKVSESNTGDWLLLEQDDDSVCVSRRQAEQLVRYLEDFTETRDGK